jgi:hypothetical protein
MALVHNLYPSGSGDNERDPQGWNVAPVADQDLVNFEAEGNRGVWDSVTTPMLLRKLTPRPGENLVILSATRGSPSCSPYAGLFKRLSIEMRISGRIAPADHLAAGQMVNFPEIPTPSMITGLMNNASNQMNPWTEQSIGGTAIPYAALSGDSPGQLVIGMLDSSVQTRTQAILQF